MRALFIELPAFERLRNEYLDDESFRAMQNALMDDPSAGDVIQGTGGLRKLRWTDKRRGKGKRGGLRTIYFYWIRGLEFWLFTLYDKNELSDLSEKDRETLEGLLKTELKMRRRYEEKAQFDGRVVRRFCCAGRSANRQAHSAHPCRSN